MAAGAPLYSCSGSGSTAVVVVLVATTATALAYCMMLHYALLLLTAIYCTSTKI